MRLPNVNYQETLTNTTVLGRDVEVEIVDVVKEREQLEKSVGKEKDRLRAIERGQGDQKEESRRLTREIRDCEQRERSLERSIRDLREVEEDEPEEEMSSLGAEVLNQRDAVKRLEGEVQKGQEQLHSIEEALKPLIAMKEEITQKLNVLRVDESSVRAREKRLLEKAVSEETRIDRVKGQVSRLHEELKNTQADVQAAKMIWEREKRTAEQKQVPFCESDKTAEELDREISTKKRQLEAQQRQHGSIDELRATERRMKKELRSKKKDLEANQEFATTLEGALERRKVNYEDFQRHLLCRSNDSFARMMTRGKHGGSVEFDVAAKRIALRVTANPHDAATAAAAAQGELERSATSTLSGGERTFCTLCYVLAVWENIDSPIIFFDECDVFMDKDKRTLSMNMLMDEAELCKRRQLVMVTPNAMTAMKESRRHPHIVRVRKTVDQQQSINFGRPREDGAVDGGE